MPINNQVNNLTVKCTIGGFHVMPRDHKIIELDHISQDTNFWLSSHDFSKVAIIQKFYYFPKCKRVLYGAAMLDDIAHQIMTGKPKIGKLTKATELYPYLES